MRKHDQLCRLSISERLYAGLVWFYPKPFRDTFGSSMMQVFRDQCSDTINKNGWYGLIALWIRVLLDFAWTCPKEHLIALPTLPGRLWQRVVAKPIWLYPMLAALACFLIGLIIALQVPKFHSSSAILLKRTIMDLPSHSGIRVVGDHHAPDLDAPNSKVVLDPVIERLGLQAAYQKELRATSPITKEDALNILSSRIALKENRRDSAVTIITVYDDDKTNARKIAQAITDEYMRVVINSSKSERPDPLIPYTANLTVLKQPEISDRLVRPGFRIWLLRGGTSALTMGAVTLLWLLIIRRRNRITTLSVKHSERLETLS